MATLLARVELDQLSLRKKTPAAASIIPTSKTPRDVNPMGPIRVSELRMETSSPKLAAWKPPA